MIENTILEGLFSEILEEKKQFEVERIGHETFKHSRWHTHLEGIFIDHLETLSIHEATGLVTSEGIGRYVVSFFSAMIDDEAFSL
jgi:hypothetical protein